MSKAANSIRKGLEEAVAYAKGRGSKKTHRVHVPEHVDVKAIRAKLGMTQQAFAARFGFSINTLRHWEPGKREPRGANASIFTGDRTSAECGSRGAADCFRHLRLQRWHAARYTIAASATTLEASDIVNVKSMIAPSAMTFGPHV